MSESQGDWVKGHRCPRCNSRLLIDESENVCCSFIKCSYGLDSDVKLTNGVLTETRKQTDHSEPANMTEIIARNVVKVTGSSWPRGARLDSRVHNCPCCGKSAYLVAVPKAFSPVYGVQYYYIGCSGCSVRTGLSSDLVKLIEDWNNRQEPILEWLKKEIEKIKSDYCNWDYHDWEYARFSDSEQFGLMKGEINHILNRILSLKKPEETP